MISHSRCFGLAFLLLAPFSSFHSKPLWKMTDKRREKEKEEEKVKDFFPFQNVISVSGSSIRLPCAFFPACKRDRLRCCAGIGSIAALFSPMESGTFSSSLSGAGLRFFTSRPPPPPPSSPPAASLPETLGRRGNNRERKSRIGNVFWSLFSPQHSPTEHVYVKNVH